LDLIFAREVARILGASYEIRRAKGGKCDYCGILLEGECFKARVRIGIGGFTYKACSREHAERLIARILGREYALRLSDADVLQASFMKLVKIISPYGYSNCIDATDPHYIHCYPEVDRPELVIRNYYPQTMLIDFDYIELAHRKIIEGVLDGIAYNFVDANKTLILDIRHTPYYELEEVKRTALEIYCRYARYGFKPDPPVDCDE